MTIVKPLKDKCSLMNFWLVCIVVTFILMPPIGSAGSVVILLMSVAAWKVWLFDRPEVSLKPTEKWVFAIVCFYFFTTLVCSLLSAEKLSDTVLVWNNLGLVIALSLLPILRLKIDDTWLNKIVISVAFAGILIAIITQAMIFTHVYNLKVLSGNALILAYLVGLNAVLGLAFFLSCKKYSLLSFLGVSASIFALLMTGRRGPLIAVILAFLPILIFAARDNLRKILILSICVVVIGGGGVILKGPEFLNTPRIEQTLERIADPFNAEISERSIYVRLSMYQDGLTAFTKRPLLGYGRQNVAQAAAVHGLHAEPEFNKYNYSHLHNALITEAVASGILGIIGLIGMYLVPIIVSWRGSPIVRVMGISYSVYFFAYTSTNIGFYHDVTVFSFIFIVAILNALASKSWEKA